MGKIKFLIADDHPTFREGLARILQDEDDLECIGKAADGLEAVRMAKELQPDVVLVDIAMPNLDGIAAAKQIRAGCPDSAVIVISAFDYDSYILAALQAGAAGYMLKTTPLGELISAIRLVNRGESVLDVKATGKLVRHLRVGSNETKPGFEPLQSREGEVLNLAAKGMSNKEIARTLAISERTVQTHLLNIFRKLGVNSRTQAVLYALRKGWITLDDGAEPPPKPS